MASFHSAPQTNGPLPDLPNEILLLVVQNCSRATLKNVRLASKSLAQMADPYLWRKVVLVPNEHCILGFIKALKRSKVTQLITKVKYDARFGSFFGHIKKYGSNAARPPMSDEEKARAEALLDRAAQGRFQPYEDMAIEVAMLTRALKLLPNLRDVRVRDCDDGTRIAFAKIPYFYQHICKSIKVDPEIVNFKLMAGGSGRSFSKGILTAAYSAGCRLQGFKMTNLDGRALFGVVPMKSSAAHQQLRIFQAMMENLRFLDLSFRNDTLMTTANHVDAVQALLKSAKKLRTLRLRLTDCSVTHHQYADDELLSDLGGLLETPTGSWISRPLLPRLEALMIEACICHDEDLMHFLKIHASTLRRLELSNITLLGSEDRRECWVKLIKNIKTDLKLTSVSFSGWFSNGGRQQWFVAKDSVCVDRLKARVERYVVDNRIRECPLEPIAIKPNQSDVAKPANGEEYEGDMTWAMVYSNRLGDEMDWTLTEPSFSISSAGGSEVSSASGDTNSPINQGTAHWEDPEEPIKVLGNADNAIDVDMVFNFSTINKTKPKPPTVHHPFPSSLSTSSSTMYHPKSISIPGKLTSASTSTSKW
ncbi:hypothetical protein A1O1_00471 [Capronia coronata CBS 617.96]|uniref:F-box domain-containing protein n=1 Tax=Capronia coronata CBS 617.96 TaxID=1182541 RepID=W9Z1C9_9EURO|nr:uncharacterized protein A1O1_00471 [Capronia coronata CBS 617.96]EXJ95351.1 hypothetical protein A1O1_00471 [Capronia coronata CBS 617.96]